MTLLRSALYQLILVAVVIPYSGLVLCTAPLPHLVRWRVIAGWPQFAFWLSRHLLRIDYEVHGREHIPAKPCVVVSKHIFSKLEEMVTEASTLDTKYRGKIISLDARGLLDLLIVKDDMSLKYEGVVDYCSLRYSADSTDLVSKQLHEAMRTATTRAGKSLAFMEVELSKLLSVHPQLVNDPLLSEYKHYLERMVRRIPHVLSEAEEKVIISKDKNGVSAWYQLQGDWLSTRTYKMKKGDEEKILPYGEIISYYQSQNREERRLANQVVYEGLGKDDIVWASAIRAVRTSCLEVFCPKKDCQLHYACNYESPGKPFDRVFIDIDAGEGTSQEDYDQLVVPSGSTISRRE